MINQLLPTISYGDAVSNSAVNLMHLLNKMGFKSKIYAQNIHPKMTKYVLPANKCPRNQHVIYHMSTGSELADEIPYFTQRKIMIYHNITPEHYFAKYNGVNQALCRQGREQLRKLASTIEYSIAVSEFNRRELDEYGYVNTYVAPIIINYSDYSRIPDKNLINTYADDSKINILFVGRITPNKKQEDIIKTFYYYKKYVNNNSRLFLVGSYQGMERYYHELVRLIKYLNLEDVYITGHLSFEEILAYYRLADIFLCMSEHEGFCVPLLEAMYFKIPIIAFNSSAVGETLSNGGVLIDSKDYKAIAELIEEVNNNQKFKDRIINNQQNRLVQLSKDNSMSIYEQHFKKLMGS